MRQFIVTAVVVLAVTACGGNTDVAEPPSLSDDLVFSLQTRAFVRACEASSCDDNRIYSSVLVNEVVRESLREIYGEEIEFLSDEPPTGNDGTYEGGIVKIDVQPLETTERADVVSVDVWTSYGFNNASGTTYLFKWDGSGWIDTTPTSAGVTFTTSVT
jgi:hypothetical protein